jgi:hypothetical protein
LGGGGQAAGASCGGDQAGGGLAAGSVGQAGGASGAGIWGQVVPRLRAAGVRRKVPQDAHERGLAGGA